MALVNIKGYNQNLLFIFEPGTIEEYLEYLEKVFTDKPQLFKGSAAIFSGEGFNNLSREDILALQRLCLKYDVMMQNTLQREKAGSKDLIIYRTLRSGQQVHSEGSIIIWGNVNESAEITAAGDVIVLGRLEGIAHAGCYGNTECVIMALSLCPLQLRIGNIISRSSGEMVVNDYPEIAFVEGENICIKGYDPRDAVR